MLATFYLIPPSGLRSIPTSITKPSLSTATCHHLLPPLRHLQGSATMSLFGLSSSLPVHLFSSGPPQSLHWGLGADVTWYAYSWLPPQSGRCTEMAISLGAMRDSQRMCSMGWRRKTDASQAASESDFQKHIAVVFFLSFFFFFFNFFAHTAGHVGS